MDNHKKVDMDATLVFEEETEASQIKRDTEEYVKMITRRAWDNVCLADSLQEASTKRGRAQLQVGGRLVV